MRLGVQGAWNTVCRGGLNLLFPPHCAACGAELAVCEDDCSLCVPCREKLGPEVWRGCPRCGSLGAGGTAPAAGCVRCRGSRLWVDHVVPLGAYRDELRQAVLKMKHSGGDPLSTAVARWYAKRRGAELTSFQPDMVVAVPMYWTRRLARGTNSAEIIAGHIAPQLGVPLASGMLVRCRNTLPQADLSPSQRFRNVSNAFRLKAGYDLRDTKVVLVDDILTTGATCSEIAKVLKRAGAIRVLAAVVARAEGQGAR